MSEVISIRTWISIASIFALLLIGSSAASAQLLGEESETYDTDDLDTGFVIPQYQTPHEIIFDFALPFFLISFLLKIALQQALFFTTVAPEESLGEGLVQELFGQQSQRSQKAGRRSQILSLIITGILVPTNIFRLVNYYITFLFGSISFLLPTFMVAVFVYAVYKALR